MTLTLYQISTKPYFRLIFYIQKNFVHQHISTNFYFPHKHLYLQNKEKNIDPEIYTPKKFFPQYNPTQNKQKLHFIHEIPMQIFT